MDFGRVFNTRAIDSNSKVEFFEMATGTAINGSFYQAEWLSLDFPSNMYIIDNDAEKKVAIIWQTGGGTPTYYLRVYIISTVDETITLDSTTTFVPPASPFVVFGIKKEGATYYIYCAYANGSDFIVGRIDIVPGVGYTNNALETIPNWGASEFVTIDRTVYFGSANGSVVIIYSFGLETEILTEVESWDTGQTPYLTLAQKNGSVVWIVSYITQGTPDTLYVYVNGENVVTTAPSGGDLAGPAVSIKQYNYVDYVYTVVVQWGFTPIYYQTITINANNEVTTYDGQYAGHERGSKPVFFRSKHTFPAMAYAQTTDISGVYKYYWVSNVTGLKISEVSIPGVSTIRSVYPTLDTKDGAIYVDSIMSDTSIKIVGISIAASIIRQLSVDLGITYSPYANTVFNHGNIFIHQQADTWLTYTNLRYLINPIGKPHCMIFEYN